MDKEQVLKLLNKYTQLIEYAKMDFHNVNQWSEDLGDGDTHDKRINKALSELENAIKNS